MANWMANFKEKKKNERIQCRKQELEGIINVRILDGKLKVVIKNNGYIISIDPSMFKEEKIEDIVQQIRNDNLSL